MRLELNMMKIKVAITGKTDFAIDGGHVETVDCFCMLGLVINNRGSITQEI